MSVYQVTLLNEAQARNGSSSCVELVLKQKRMSTIVVLQKENLTMALIKRKDTNTVSKVKGPIRCHKCQVVCCDAEHYLSHKCWPKSSFMQPKPFLVRTQATH